MGAADVVPGVSGGTIAFISGIYEELISSISKINLQALKISLKARALHTVGFHPRRNCCFLEIYQRKFFLSFTYGDRYQYYIAG